MHHAFLKTPYNNKKLIMKYFLILIVIYLQYIHINTYSFYGTTGFTIAVIVHLVIVTKFFIRVKAYYGYCKNV